MASEAKSFTSLSFGNTGDLEHHGSGFHLSDVELWFTFAASHLDIKRFLGDRNVREDADPDLTTTFDVTSDSLTSGFDLTTVNALVI